MASSSSATKKAPPASYSVRQQLFDGNANIDYNATNNIELRFPRLLSIQEIDKKDEWATTTFEREYEMVNKLKALDLLELPRDPDIAAAQKLPTLVLGSAPPPNVFKTKKELKENTKVDRGQNFEEKIACCIKLDDHWIPKIFINIDIQFSLPQGSNKKVDQYRSTAILAFTARNIDALQYRRVEDMQDLDQSVYTGHSEQELQDDLDDGSFEIRFEAHGSIHASNVFPTDPNFGCHDKALEHLRAIVRRPIKVIFLTRGGSIPSRVETFQHKIAEQQKRKQPLYKQFFPTGGDNIIVVQKGNFAKKEDRADGRQFPAPSFFADVPEWLIHVVYSELEAHEYRNMLREPVPMKSIWTRLPGTEIPADEKSQPVSQSSKKSIGDSRYLVIVKSGSQRTTLKPEDMCDLFFDGDLSEAQKYKCKVLESIPYSGPNDIVLQVDRPFGEAGWDRTNLKDDDMPILDQIEKPRDAFRAIQTTRPKLVWLRPWNENEEKTFKQTINTIAAVYDKIKTKHYPHIHKYILGNDLTPNTYVNLWAATDKLPAADMSQLKEDIRRVGGHLHKEQNHAMIQFSQAPDGWVFIKGCACTGKSEVLKVVVTLMALQRKEIPGPTKVEEKGALGPSAPGGINEQLTNKAFLALKDIVNPWLSIIVVPMDRTANDLADSMSAFVKSHVKHREVMIVRVYPYKTEDDIVKREANLAGWKDYRNHPLARPKLFELLRELYDRYALDPDWDEEDSASLSQEIGKAVAYVLRRADAVILTPSSLAEDKIRLPIEDTRLLAYDEASRITDVRMCSGLGQVNAKIILLCGDSTQGTPITKTPHSGNQFVSYAKVSFMGRCIVNGAAMIELFVQNRFHPNICDVISPIWYDGKLVTGPHPLRQERSKQLTKLMKGWFGKDTNCLWLNVKGGETRMSAAKSQSNSYNVGIAIYMVRRLLEEKNLDLKPRDIGILTPYHAQYQRYRRAQAWLQTLYPELDMSELVIEKSDDIQGGQVDILINDFTIVDTAGFMTDASRPLLAASRAKQLELNIGKLSRIETIGRLKGSKLQDFITEHKKNRMMYHWTDKDEGNKAKYLPPNYSESTW
ncbi:MAG: hypothetical protein Q9157_006851 [Trypethelium eluteriae]